MVCCQRAKGESSYRRWQMLSSDLRFTSRRKSELDSGDHRQPGRQAGSKKAQTAAGILAPRGFSIKFYRPAKPHSYKLLSSVSSGRKILCI